MAVNIINQYLPGARNATLSHRVNARNIKRLIQTAHDSVHEVFKAEISYEHGFRSFFVLQALSTSFVIAGNLAGAVYGRMLIASPFRT
jgi:hypothetical protein